jgi:hypothetical protein
MMFKSGGFDAQVSCGCGSKAFETDASSLFWKQARQGKNFG